MKTGEAMHVEHSPPNPDKNREKCLKRALKTRLREPHQHVQRFEAPAEGEVDSE
ncbi:MAG: hypothetical protein QXI42_07480 [Thermoproteota archaeon]|nr:hypothetical protein [Candidatus Brockarchaeota archaeon]